MLSDLLIAIMKTGLSESVCSGVLNSVVRNGIEDTTDDTLYFKEISVGNGYLYRRKPSILIHNTY